MDEINQQFVERQKGVWSLGEYEPIAEVLRPASLQVAEVTGVASGSSVLDVGAGTGNFAVEAAGRGAKVDAVDLTPHMIELGRTRTIALGLDVEWGEADAQELPFEDSSFDVVGSVFAAMFAPSADAAVREMLRVVKPGGHVGFTSWKSDGFTGEMLKISGKYMPPPPEGIDTPISWGDEHTARSRFEGHADSVEVLTGSVMWQFESEEASRRFFEEQVPPTVAAKMVLPPEVFSQMIDELQQLRDEVNRGSGGRVEIDAEYWLVHARKTG